MPHICLICKKDSDHALKRSMHKFPSDGKQRKKWMDSLKLTSIRKNALICCDHFSPDSFRRTFGLEHYVCLKPNVIPHLKNYHNAKLPTADFVDDCYLTNNESVIYEEDEPNYLVQDGEQDCSTQVHSQHKYTEKEANIVLENRKLYASIRNSMQHFLKRDFTSEDAWQRFEMLMDMLKSGEQMYCSESDDTIHITQESNHLVEDPDDKVEINYYF